MKIDICLRCQYEKLNVNEEPCSKCYLVRKVFWLPSNYIPIQEKK